MIADQETELSRANAEKIVRAFAAFRDTGGLVLSFLPNPCGCGRFEVRGPKGAVQVRFTCDQLGKITDEGRARRCATALVQLGAQRQSDAPMMPYLRFRLDPGADN